MAAITFFATFAGAAAVPVILSPVPKLQFFDASGRPLAFGCVFSYQSGTTTPLATYTDATGLVQNLNPVILDAGGFAGSGSSEIWLQAGQAYTLKVKAFGGTNCASGATLYSVDGIGGGGATVTTNVNCPASCSFVISAQVQLFAVNLTGNSVAGTLSAVGIVSPALVIFQITQDGAGGHTFTWPSNSIGGALVGAGANQVTTQEFVWNGTNATAIASANEGAGPLQVAGTFNATTGLQLNGSFGTAGACLQSTGSGTVFAPSCAALIIANNGGSGTTLNTLTKLTGAPSTAVITSTNDASGIVGITIANAGTVGNATVQQFGNALCVFDGGVVAGDYVVNSPTVAGNCHDSGVAPPAFLPSGVQILGQVLSTSAGVGTYNVNLYGPDAFAPSGSFILTNAGVTGTTVNKLAKQSAAPSTAVIAAITDNSGILGIVVAGAGTSGNATIQGIGLASCVFDGATTANDYVVNSPTTAGDCHDSGIAPPTLPSGGVQNLGQVLSTNVGAGTYAVNLYGPGLIFTAASANAPQRVVLAAPSALVANTQKTILTKSVTFPSGVGTYRAQIGYNLWVEVGANVCVAEVIDHTNNTAFASSGQTSNGSGELGMAAMEITAQTYAAGAVVSFTLDVQCNNAGGGLTGATVQANGGTFFAMSPQQATYLAVTPILSN